MDISYILIDDFTAIIEHPTDNGDAFKNKLCRATEYRIFNVMQKKRIKGTVIPTQLHFFETKLPGVDNDNEITDKYIPNTDHLHISFYMEDPIKTLKYTYLYEHDELLKNKNDFTLTFYWVSVYSTNYDPYTDIIRKSGTDDLSFHGMKREKGRISTCYISYDSWKKRYNWPAWKCYELTNEEVYDANITANCKKRLDFLLQQ